MFDATVGVDAARRLEISTLFLGGLDRPELGTDVEIRLAVFRDGVEVYTKEDWVHDIDWVPLFNADEDAGAEYRVLFTSTSVVRSSSKHPQLLFNGVTIDVQFDVLVVPAPASVLSLAAFGLVLRRRR